MRVEIGQFIQVQGLWGLYRAHIGSKMGRSTGLEFGGVKGEGFVYWEMHGRPDATMHIRVCVVGLGFDLRVPGLWSRLGFCGLFHDPSGPYLRGLDFECLGCVADDRLC